jgi:sulfonate transport system ATP-binding protein
MNAVSLRADGVEKWFRQSKKGAWLKVLDDVSFEVYSHEFVSIIGASGCGKTTLLKTCAGLIESDRGTVTLEGQPVRGVPEGIGFVFQDPALLVWESVWKNIELGLGRRRMSNSEKDRLVKEQLALVGLADFARSHPYQLSGGMQQRVGLARALIGRPRLLLLDEPLGALDAFTRVRLQEELSSIVTRASCTSMLVTHDVDEALFLSDRIIVMSTSPGRIRSVVDIDEPKPRNRTNFLADPRIVRLKSHITSSIVEGAAGQGAEDDAPAANARSRT